MIKKLYNFIFIIFLINVIISGCDPRGQPPPPLRPSYYQNIIFFDWSPDGKQIAFVYQNKEKKKIENYTLIVRNHIYTIDIDGSNLKKIAVTNEPSNYSNVTGLTWSSDRKYFFLIDIYGFYKINVDGSEVKKITPENLEKKYKDKQSVVVFSPSVFSLDYSKIAYVADKINSSHPYKLTGWAIGVMDINGENPEIFDLPISQYPARSLVITWLPNNKLIINSNYYIDLNTKKIEEISTNLSKKSIFKNCRWLNNKEFLTYRYEDKEMKIYKYTINTDILEIEKEELVSTPEFFPDTSLFSPDGTQIAYIIKEKGQKGEFIKFPYIMNIDGSNKRKLVDVTQLPKGDPDYIW